MNPAEDYILRQPEPFKSILLHLQILIEHTFPDAELLYKWRIPFYYNNGIPLCFLNQSKDYVDFAFWHREKFNKYTEHFVITNRKTVTSLRYRSIEDVDDEVVIYVLKRQLEINTNPFKLIRKSKG